MALNGKQEPNFDNVKIGNTQEQIDFEFQTEGRKEQKENGQYEVTYEYELGNTSNPARASMYAYIDLATIGLAEPVLFLIELFQGHNEFTQVLYGSDHRAAQITGYTAPPPSASLEAAREMQDKWVRKPPQPRPKEVEPQGLSTEPGDGQQAR